MKLLAFEKKLSLSGAVCVTVGAVIGVGIFVIVRPIGNATGPWMPVAFAVAALPAIFGTVVAVSLGSTIPADGGGYYYTKSLLGRYPGAAASAMVVFGAMGALATVSVGIANYLQPYLPGIPAPAVSIALILLSWGVNHAGIMASERFQIGMVLQQLRPYTHLNVRHFAATPVGLQVTATAELVKVEGRTLTFRVAATDDRGPIGDGEHVRIIVNVASFDKRAQDKLT